MGQCTKANIAYDVLTYWNIKLAVIPARTWRKQLV